MKAFYLIAGLILGFSLASWAWSDTARATARNQVKALEQIEISRELNKRCEAALETVWGKIEVGRQEEKRRLLGDREKWGGK
jgi:hypothetical protein